MFLSRSTFTGYSKPSIQLVETMPSMQQQAPNCKVLRRGLLHVAKREFGGIFSCSFAFFPCPLSHTPSLARVCEQILMQCLLFYGARVGASCFDC